MIRCLNCMEEYDESRDRCPGCDYCQGESKPGPFILEEGSILQGRYIVGTYKLIRTCDITYIGWDALFNRKVLIQEFYPEDFVERLEQKTVSVKNNRGGLYNESLNQFIYYFRNLIRLYKEKDIISVYSCFKENGTAYATMEYSSAATLSEWLKDSPGRDAGDAMYTFYQAVEAVKKVHNLGFIHGNITLDSFWVTAAGELVLKDFAEHYYRCNDDRPGTHREVKPWIDVYGLSALFGKIILGQEDVSEKDIRRILESKEYKFPIRTVVAIKKGIAGRGNGINSLDEFYDRIFGDSATMHLVKQKSTRHHGRRLNKKKCALLAWAVILLVYSAVAFAGVLKSGNGDAGGKTVNNTSGETWESGNDRMATTSNAFTQTLTSVPEKDIREGTKTPRETTSAARETAKAKQAKTPASTTPAAETPTSAASEAPETPDSPETPAQAPSTETSAAPVTTILPSQPTSKSPVVVQSADRAEGGPSGTGSSGQGQEAESGNAAMALPTEGNIQ